VFERAYALFSERFLHEQPVLPAGEGRMAEKFDYYDILGTVIPGTLLLACAALCFPELVVLASGATYPDAFAVIILTSLAIFLGQIVTSIASLAEPLLYKTWGGRPSDMALSRGLGSYLSASTASRIQAKLKPHAGAVDEQSLFLYAMHRSDAAGIGRAARFNSLYAYHRSLLILSLVVAALLGASMIWGRASSWNVGWKIASLVVMASLAWLVWFRTKQRAFYYVREVLLTAEREIDKAGGANARQ
jgi:hypothetical protein